MRKETVTERQGKIDSNEDWSRLSDIRFMKACGVKIGYYIEVSKAGDETRAVILGDPVSDSYVGSEGDILRDFRPVDYYNKGLKAHISKELGRSDEKIRFV